MFDSTAAHSQARPSSHRSSSRGVEDASAPGGEAAHLADEELVARFSELAGHLNSGNARFILMLGEIDARRIWADHGAKTCGEWLSWRVGISGVAAREQLRVARALKELPLTSREFVAGRISYSKVRALTRVGTPETEADLVMWATHTSAADIERFCRTYRKVVGQAELEAANERHRRRHVSWYFDDDGSLVIVGRLSPEEGAVVVKALEAGRDLERKSRRDGGLADEVAGEPEERDERRDDVATQSVHDNVSAETSSDDDAGTRAGPPSNADALVTMAHNLLANPPRGPTSGSLPQVLVHVDLDVLRGVDEDAARCALEGGPAIAPETARRLSCDCAVVPVIENDGEPLTTGKKSRAIPTAVRRALLARDGCCRWPGCDRKVFVEAHHVQFWGRGGPHTLSNLVLLCWHHHRHVHEGGFTMETMGSGRFRFLRPDGSEIEKVPQPPASGPGLLEATTSAAAIPIDSETCVPDWDGVFMDLSDAVEGMLAANGLL